MPLLVCPNDDAAMQTIKRSGVEFDFCPTCRGVWLDRGELDKIVERSSMEETAGPGDRYESRRGKSGGDRYDRAGKPKRKSFLGDLFDFG